MPQCQWLVPDGRLWSLRAAVHLPVTFRSTYSLLVLHVWLCLVRLRKDGPERGAPVGQMLYDLFQHDVEKRVVKEGVSGPGSAQPTARLNIVNASASMCSQLSSPTVSPSRFCWPSGAFTPPQQALTELPR